MCTIRCKMVPVHRWRYDEHGLAWYVGFYMPVPIGPDENEEGTVECTESYLEAMKAMKEATPEDHPQ